MIRINLIQAPAREAEAKIQEAPAFLQRKEFLPLVSLVVSFGIVGLLYWNANRQIDGLNRQIAAERQEAVRLAAIETQNKNYQNQLAQIKEHITLIQSLQQQRTGPQQLMTLLGNAVDRVSGLYLLSVDAQKARLSIHGQSGRVNAIADFITQLQQIPSFEDIQLRQFFEDDLKTAVNFMFDLDCVYHPRSAAANPALAGGRPAPLPPAKR
ncbi:MAG TPA: PilN domain-containing protein [Terriglobia bacterium]|nr:PilN domain-containing protein [Terriglobia bacterium]HEX5482676.1 PilN domain-containing protein [Terriglobia bacterium]